MGAEHLQLADGLQLLQRGLRGAGHQSHRAAVRDLRRDVVLRARELRLQRDLQRELRHGRADVAVDCCGPAADSTVSGAIGTKIDWTTAKALRERPRGSWSIVRGQPAALRDACRRRCAPASINAVTAVALSQPVDPARSSSTARGWRFTSSAISPKYPSGVSDMSGPMIFTRRRFLQQTGALSALALACSMERLGPGQRRGAGARLQGAGLRVPVRRQRLEQHGDADHQLRAVRRGPSARHERAGIAQAALQPITPTNTGGQIYGLNPAFTAINANPTLQGALQRRQARGRRQRRQPDPSR